MAARARELVLECDALLRGRYVDLLWAEGRPTPAWAWVNSLAHATPEELATWAAEQPPAAGDDTPGFVSDAVSEVTAWRLLLSFLAEDLLAAAAAGPATLGELQRFRLLPLELDLMRSQEHPEPNAGRVATLVMAALRRPQRKPLR